MAHALPVVAPASGGPLEIVVDGETGLLYRPGDVEDAAACVLRLIRDPELAGRMGAAGRMRVESEFRSSAQVETTRRLLSSAAESPRRSDALAGG
jgi:glycosyltransferase involved in cell wall biosynthesis